MFDWLWRRRRPRTDNTLSFRQSYASFRRLLSHNSELLGQFVDLETDLRYRPSTDPRVHERIRRVLGTSLELIQDLSELTDGRTGDLFEAHKRIETDVLEQLSRARDRPQDRVVSTLDEPEAKKELLSGGKAKRLAELRHVIPNNVPSGFVVTTHAYRQIVDRAGLVDHMLSLLASARGDEATYAERAGELRQLLERVVLPGEIRSAIGDAASQFERVSLWAVRSSAVGEDGSLSFAGQFDTLLGVPHQGLLEAYRSVVASRFSERAVAYRQGSGLAEVETPMAVLFVPMIDACASGVLYTRIPHSPEADSMWISSTIGLGAEVVSGTASADLFVVARASPAEVLERHLATKERALVLRKTTAGVCPRPTSAHERDAPSIDDETIARLAELGLAVERYFGGPQDIEWAQDTSGSLWILQARPLATHWTPARKQPAPNSPSKLTGRPLAPGRAVGRVHRVSDLGQLGESPEGSVLVVRLLTPDVARVLGRISAVVAETGSPQSHAATLVRQARIPAIFNATDALKVLEDGEPVGVDGTRGQVYCGEPWSELADVGRQDRPATHAPQFALAHEKVLRLNLIDPNSSSFAASHCESIHDLVRLVHERALEAMFRLGDRHTRRGWRTAKHLASPVPLDLEVLDLGDGLSAEAKDRRRVAPESILSIPFAALWKGISDQRVSWAGRRAVSMGGFVSVLQTSMLEEGRSLRKLGDRNYLIVAHDYLNLNARLAYHYAMIDTVVGEVPENNYVAFRFQGGGAGLERRDLRAQFLAEVTAAFGFTVDRRGDLLNAWLRTAPRSMSEEGLTRLGLLMACSRQLDMLLSDRSAVRHFVSAFLAGKFDEFA